MMRIGQERLRGVAAMAGLQQVLQGRIHSRHAHQHGTSAAFLQHLRGDGAGGVGGGGVGRKRWHRSAGSTGRLLADEAHRLGELEGSALFHQAQTPAPHLLFGDIKKHSQLINAVRLVETAEQQLVDISGQGLRRRLGRCLHWRVGFVLRRRPNRFVCRPQSRAKTWMVARLVACFVAGIGAGLAVGL